MERKNTEPLFNSEDFTEYMANSSFTDKLGSSDIIDILECNSATRSTVLEQKGCKQEYVSWCNIDEEVQDNPGSFLGVAIDDAVESSQLPAKLMQDDSNSSYEEESNLDSDKVPSLGFESWPGPLNFSINFKSTTFSNSKWCYNSDINKLYIMRTASVPIEVYVDNWENAMINVTPVFLRSQNICEPVLRCHNHRIADEARGEPNPMHIVEVVNQEANHKLIGERYSVEIPLGQPAPGEDSRIIHIRSGCWNTCVGPSRRNYCLIFTLFSKDGCEIGRQVVNFKSCQSPSRDMGKEMKKNSKAIQTKRKINAAAKESTKKSKTDNTDKDSNTYESIAVLTQIAPDVKKYVNLLMADLFAKTDKNFFPPYPEV